MFLLWLGKGQVMRFLNWKNNLSVETGTWTIWTAMDIPLCTGVHLQVAGIYTILYFC